ncbi:hypothetical protein KR51_00003780 [Rubidibacter lacunae KORDI 51-2]|uniref:Uncharacterized protein n=1 Tax=Rubidibacter lacunae KORDI 51-2 TaxID=582515 RepID=U5DQE7_9CHRO|nr:hypothetical protein [Rubidibacter lacunae]ERN43062.1 hypothetical protein KR51_00003780 [Rubidibacter lacunae KORDI 51-2]
MANWGPDRNLSLDQGKIYVLKVPANRRAEFHFSCESWYENAAIIYNNDPTDPQVFAERGNYACSLSDWNAPIVPHDATYMITSWNKSSPPRAQNPWYKAPIKSNLKARDTSSSGLRTRLTTAITTFL